MERKTFELLAECLAAHRVEHLFGLVGDANLYMVDAWVRAGHGRYTALTHEANAVLAALGYAQVAGRVGVATITHGPALTNVVTALAEGAKGGIPAVVMAGDTAPGDLEHLQKIDQREIVKASGAGFVELRAPDTAAEDLARAFRRAALERRPIVFNMRADLMWQPTAAAPVAWPVPQVRAAVPEGEAFDEAAGMIASARRPLILAGRGAVQARAALERLAARLQAPVSTTLKASGLFQGHPHDLGVFGGLSGPVTVEAILQSDCIIAFGASLSRQTTEAGSYLRGRRVVQVLADPMENDRRTEPTVLLIGDIAATAARLAKIMDEAEIPPSGAADAALAARLAGLRAAPPAPFAATAPGTIDAGPALQRLDAALTPDRVLVGDLGRFTVTAWGVLSVRAPGAFVYSCNFGAIGCGMGEAIGAARAAPGRRTVLLAGDGGFLLGGLAELSTAVREGLDLVVLLHNDGAYGAEHIQFTAKGMDPGLSLIHPPDFVALARAMGARALRIAAPGDIGPAIAALADRRGPLLIDLALDPHAMRM
ncbi:thiamine pyrophosphate-binding protein [Frigidibacter sp. MR17.24]|uniref:thiamine pyrophosphate-binding protein n=1 Tax=Frigidibacter sp. MR17.24 TaxID=3127345 RepID=UPI003012EB1D